jgi:hypothetical protein
MKTRGESSSVTRRSMVVTINGVKGFATQIILLIDVTE